MDDLVNRLRSSAHKMTQTHAILQRGYGAQTSMEDDAEREIILDAAADLIEAQAAQLQEARRLMEIIESKVPNWIRAMKDWDEGGEDAVFELRLAEEELGAFLAKSQ